MGLVAYVSSALARTTCVELQTPHTLWLRARGGAGADGDLFLCAVYLPPRTSRTWARGNASAALAAAFAALRDQILQFQQHGRVLILGDFNARTGTLSDSHPEAAELLAAVSGDTPTTGSAPTERSSADTRADASGGLLIDTVCLPTACVIVNGRAPHTQSAAFTYETTRSGRPLRSCLDYCIVDATAFPHVSSFKIKPHRGLSDHNILTCTYSPTPTPPAPAPAADTLPPRPHFDEAHREAWAARLQSSPFENAWDRALALPTASDAVAAAVKLLYDAATEEIGRAHV